MFAALRAGDSRLVTVLFPSRAVRLLACEGAPLFGLPACYNSILRPISVNALAGILNRSMACAELRDMNENNAMRHRDSGFRCLRLLKSPRSM